MVTDPKTSPLLPDQFINFGILTAVGSFMALIFFPSALFIGGLLAADAFVRYLNYRSLRKLKQPAWKNGALFVELQAFDFFEIPGIESKQG